MTNKRSQSFGNAKASFESAVLKLRTASSAQGGPAELWSQKGLDF